MAEVFSLVEDFLKPNGIESVYVTCAVCYPYISHEEYIEKGLNKISHDILTITKDDLEEADFSLADIMENIENSEAEELDFEILTKVSKKFIQRWGNPHTTIIITQDGIEILNGEKAKPFGIKDWGEYERMFTKYDSRRN